MNKEILWNLVNSILAGLISLTSSSLVVGEISVKGVCIAVVVAFSVGVVQFKNYWDTEKLEYTNKMFSIVKV